MSLYPRIPLSFKLNLSVMMLLKYWIERRDTGGEGGGRGGGGWQTGSLFMPGGRRLKENLCGLDSAPDMCVFVYLDVCVCVT